MKVDVKSNKLIINGVKVEDTKQYIENLYMDVVNTVLYLQKMKKELDLCSNTEGYDVVYPYVTKTQKNGESILVREWRGKSDFDTLYSKVSKYIDNFDGVEQ